jgi:hypothetical protein
MSKIDILRVMFDIKDCYCKCWLLRNNFISLFRGNNRWPLYWSKMRGQGGLISWRTALLFCSLHSLCILDIPIIILELSIFINLKMISMIFSILRKHIQVSHQIFEVTSFIWSFISFIHIWSLQSMNCLCQTSYAKNFSYPFSFINLI